MTTHEADNPAKDFFEYLVGMLQAGVVTWSSSTNETIEASAIKGYDFEGGGLVTDDYRAPFVRLQFRRLLNDESVPVCIRIRPLLDIIRREEFLQHPGNSTAGDAAAYAVTLLQEALISGAPLLADAVLFAE